MAANDSGPPVSATSGGTRPSNPLGRALVITTVVNGVPRQVKMNVLAIADANGNIVADFASSANQALMLKELRGIRILLAKYLGENFVFDPLPDETAGGTSGG